MKEKESSLLVNQGCCMISSLEVTESLNLTTNEEAGVGTNILMILKACQFRYSNVSLNKHLL